VRRWKRKLFLLVVFAVFVWLGTTARHADATTFNELSSAGKGRVVNSYSGQAGYSTTGGGSGFAKRAAKVRRNVWSNQLSAARTRATAERIAEEKAIARTEAQVLVDAGETAASGAAEKTATEAVAELLPEVLASPETGGVSLAIGASAAVSLTHEGLSLFFKFAFPNPPEPLPKDSQAVINRDQTGSHLYPWVWLGSNGAGLPELVGSLEDVYGEALETHTTILMPEYPRLGSEWVPYYTLLVNYAGEPFTTGWIQAWSSGAPANGCGVAMPSAAGYSTIASSGGDGCFNPAPAHSSSLIRPGEQAALQGMDLTEPENSTPGRNGLAYNGTHTTTTAIENAIRKAESEGGEGADLLREANKLTAEAMQTMPDVSTHPVATAEHELEELGFHSFIVHTLPATEVWKPAGSGNVVETSPSPEEEVEVSAPVEIVANPEYVEVPAPLPLELYTHYIARLHELGFASTTATPDESTEPLASPRSVVKVEPEVGTVVETALRPATPIDVHFMPEGSEATREREERETKEKGGAGEGGGLPFDPPGLPNVVFPSVPTPCDKFPFAVPCWFVDELKQLVVAGTAPKVTFHVLGDPLNLNLAFGEPLMEILRPLFAFFAVIGAVMFFHRHSGHAGGGSGGGEE
jgi:hypothetical protein